VKVCDSCVKVVLNAVNLTDLSIAYDFLFEALFLVTKVFQLLVSLESLLEILEFKEYISLDLKGIILHDKIFICPHNHLYLLWLTRITLRRLLSSTIVASLHFVFHLDNGCTCITESASTVHMHEDDIDD
jgi:hypothetical protein